MMIKIIIFYESNKYSIHAEQSAIYKIKNKNIIKYCKIYIIKLDSNNNVCPASPCDMCQSLICKSKIKTIISVHNAS
jgi:deoxycytidylate deaminase